MASITSRSFVASPVPVGAVFSARGSKITRQREITFPSSGGRVQWHGDRATMRVAHQLTLTIHQTPKQSARGKWFLRLEGIGIDTPVSLTGLFRFLATKQGIKEKELARIGKRIAAVWSRMTRESARNEKRRRKVNKAVVANWAPLFGERSNFVGTLYLSARERITRKGKRQEYAYVVSPRGKIREKWFASKWLASLSNKWRIDRIEPRRENPVGSSENPGVRSSDYTSLLVRVERMRKTSVETAETPFVCRGSNPVAKPIPNVGSGCIPVSSPPLWSRESDSAILIDG